jgi:hypothetical protein
MVELGDRYSAMGVNSEVSLNMNSEKLLYLVTKFIGVLWFKLDEEIEDLIELTSSDSVGWFNYNDSIFRIYS